MEVNNELVEKLARLSRLSFNEAEKAAIRQDLEKMINFVNQLAEVDTEGTAPLLHITQNINRLRADAVGPQLTAAEALKNASVHDDNFFLVPRVIKK